MCCVSRRNYLFNLLFKTNDWFLHETQNRAEMGETDKNSFVTPCISNKNEFSSVQISLLYGIDNRWNLKDKKKAIWALVFSFKKRFHEMLNIRNKRKENNQKLKISFVPVFKFSFVFFKIEIFLRYVFTLTISNRLSEFQFPYYLERYKSSKVIDMLRNATFKEWLM